MKTDLLGTQTWRRGDGPREGSAPPGGGVGGRRSPARHSRSTAARGGAGCGRGGEGATHRPKLAFSGCSEGRETKQISNRKKKNKTHQQTNRQGRVRPAARGCGGESVGAFPPTRRVTPPAPAGCIEDARASLGATNRGRLGCRRGFVRFV